jgi:hypothetical protein
MRAPVTRVEEGFDRGSFTAPEILRMQDAGVISEDEARDRLDEALTFATLASFSARPAAI